MGAIGEIRVLYAIEGTHGTEQVPTAAWRGTAELLRVQDTAWADENVGSMSDHVRAYVQSLGSKGKLASDALTYEGLVTAFQMIFEEVVAAPAKTYTWLPDISAVLDPASLTLQYGPEDKMYQSIYVIATDLKLKMAGQKAWTADISIAGQSPTSEAAAAVTNAVETALLTGETSVYIDDTWAGLGGSKISGYVIDAEWSLPGYHQKYFMQGSLEPTSHGQDRRHATLKMLVEFNSVQEAIERAAWEALTPRFIRIYSEHLAATATLDGCYLVTDLSTLKSGKGNIQAEYTLESYQDPTSGYEYGAVVVTP